MMRKQETQRSQPQAMDHSPTPADKPVASGGNQISIPERIENARLHCGRRKHMYSEYKSDTKNVQTNG